MKKNFIAMSLCFSSILSASDGQLTFQDMFGGMSSEEVAQQLKEVHDLLESLSPQERFEFDKIVEDELAPYDSSVREYSSYNDRYPNATAKQNTQEALNTLYSTIANFTNGRLVHALSSQRDIVQAALETNQPNIIIDLIKNSGLIDVNKRLWLHQNKTILEELELNIPFLCSLYEVSTKVIKGRQS